MHSISSRKFGLGTLTFLFALMIVGCEPKGPAEKAGENLDKAGSNIKDAINPKGPAEKAGENLDKATGNR